MVVARGIVEACQDKNYYDISTVLFSLVPLKNMIGVAKFWSATLMARVPLDPFEARLLKEIEGIHVRINELTAEKAALERMLLKVRQSNTDTIKVEVTRKNSIKRVLIESIVLDELTRSGVTMKAHDIYKKLLVVDPNLKPVTFRSTLHRMKARGLIQNPQEGRWQALTAT